MSGGPIVLQDQAIVIDNNIFDALRQLAILRATIGTIQNAYAQLTLATVNGAFPTAAQNADGSLGTADATPTNGHPIDNRILTRLEIAASGYDIGVMHDLLGDIASYLDGNAVGARPAAPNMLAKVTNG